MNLPLSPTPIAPSERQRVPEPPPRVAASLYTGFVESRGHSPASWVGKSSAQIRADIESLLDAFSAEVGAGMAMIYGGTRP